MNCSAGKYQREGGGHSAAAVEFIFASSLLHFHLYLCMCIHSRLMRI